MDENETQDVDLNNEEELLDEELDENTDEDKPDEPEVKPQKPKETPEAKKARLERQLKQINKKLGAEESEPKSDSTKSDGLGYGEKAFLVAKGYGSPEVIALAQEFMDNTGKDLETIVESKFFQAEAKEILENKASSEAIPKGSKRSGASSKDTVDYWLAKGVLPENTPDNQELRRKIVDAKYKRETSGSKFTPSFNGGVTRQSQLKK